MAEDRICSVCGAPATVRESVARGVRWHCAAHAGALFFPLLAEALKQTQNDEEDDK